MDRLCNGSNILQGKAAGRICYPVVEDHQNGKYYKSHDPGHIRAA